MKTQENNKKEEKKTIKIIIQEISCVIIIIQTFLSTVAIYNIARNCDPISSNFKNVKAKYHIIRNAIKTLFVLFNRKILVKTG